MHEETKETKSNFLWILDVIYFMNLIKQFLLNFYISFRSLVLRDLVEVEIYHFSFPK